MKDRANKGDDPKTSRHRFARPRTNPVHRCRNNGHRVPSLMAPSNSKNRTTRPLRARPVQRRRLQDPARCRRSRAWFAPSVMLDHWTSGASANRQGAINFRELWKARGWLSRIRRSRCMRICAASAVCWRARWRGRRRRAPRRRGRAASGARRARRRNGNSRTAARASGSIIASAAAGPRTLATATARLSVTTGEGCSGSSAA